MTFNVTRDRTSCMLRIEGELDAVSTPTLKPSIGEITRAAPSEVLVDLSGLRLIDSAGVGALVLLYKSVRSNDGTLSVFGVRDQPLAILKLLRLDHVLMADGPRAGKSAQAQ